MYLAYFTVGNELSNFVFCNFKSRFLYFAKIFPTLYYIKYTYTNNYEQINVEYHL